jgi:ABC-type transport system substrate-binding protein
MRYGQSASGYQAIVGSGPYYLSSFSPGSSYQLKVNPAWTGTSCTWTGCIPATFPVKTVNVVWEATAQEGEIALEHGQADFATVPSTDFSSVLLPLLQNGKVTVTSAVGLSIYFTNFVMQFSQSGAEGLLAQSGTGLTLNAPSNLFQDLVFRQFLIHAYPYATVQNQFNTVDGISVGVLYGGAIAKYMGNYYPTNISWDQVDPVNSGAASWWTNVTSEPNGIAAAACTPNKPCIFPFVTSAGYPKEDAINKLWVREIESYSKGAVEPVPVDIPNGILFTESKSLPGANPMPMYDIGWSPDYPDPTDYVVPMYFPNATWGGTDALWQGLVGTETYDTACTASGWEWMVSGGVTQACQGYAYNEMISLMSSAAYDTNLQQRALLYNEAEHIAQQLGIFTPNPAQVSNVWVASSEIASNSLNSNPMIGGNGDNLFYNLE